MVGSLKTFSCEEMVNLPWEINLEENMNSQKRITLFLILFLTLVEANPLFAQKKLVLTLEESIKLALERNKGVLQAEKDIRAARAKVKQAKSGFFPQLSGQGSYTLFEGVPEIEFPISEFDPRLPPVATRKVEMDFTRDYIGSLSLTQPLFTWGRIWQGYKTAELNLKVTEERYRQSKEDAIYQVKKTFYDVLLAEEFVKVAEEAEALAKEHLRVTRIRYDAGEASEFDVLRAEVSLANLKPGVIKAQNGLELALMGLKNTLGVDLATEMEVEGELKRTTYKLSLEDCLRIALETRSEIAQLEYQKRMGERMVKLAQANDNPSLAFVASYKGENNSLSFDWDKWDKSYTGMLVLSLPIFDGFHTRARVQEAKVTVDKIELAEEELKEGIKLQVRGAHLALREAEDIIGSSEENLRQAQRSVEIAQEQYKQGMVTSLDVMSVELALTQAKTNHYQALHDLILAIAGLQRAIGVIE